MPTIQIVALRNDDLTERNIAISLNHATWGMRTAGIHKDIKRGDFVIFLIGISIANIRQLANISDFKNNVFPNYPNVVLDDDQFMGNLKFSVDKIYLGNITSDYYIDESEIWPPKINSAGKKNYYKNRFEWQLTHTAENLEFNASNLGPIFHSQIVRALRSKSVEPATVDESKLSNLLKNMTDTSFSADEIWYQEESQRSPVVSLPDGAISKNNKNKSTSNPEGWRRNVRMAASAIENAKFKCEHNIKHLTFTSKTSGENFVEAHHLIPMKFQDEFESSIDVPENIISLCPNCHRAFHYGNKQTQIELIQTFYNKKMSALNNHNRHVNISLEKLLEFYDCK
jgi:predicted HNH restriction endonuclease